MVHMCVLHALSLCVFFTLSVCSVFYLLFYCLHFRANKHTHYYNTAEITRKNNKFTCGANNTVSPISVSKTQHTTIYDNA